MINRENVVFFPDSKSDEKWKKVTLFDTLCVIEIGVNYPSNPCHRLTLPHFELTLQEFIKSMILCFCCSYGFCIFHTAYYS